MSAPQPDRQRRGRKLSRQHQPVFHQQRKTRHRGRGTPIEIAVYKVGGKYVGARSNEFGYANYEIIPTVTTLAPFN
jgi:hypothetical protein